jgi:hypothetical protein
MVVMKGRILGFPRFRDRMERQLTPWLWHPDAFDQLNPQELRELLLGLRKGPLSMSITWPMNAADFAQWAAAVCWSNSPGHLDRWNPPGREI